jgi:hypothetical protein
LYAGQERGHKEKPQKYARKAYNMRKEKQASAALEEREGEVFIILIYCWFFSSSVKL